MSEPAFTNYSVIYEYLGHVELFHDCHNSDHEVDNYSTPIQASV